MGLTGGSGQMARAAPLVGRRRLHDGMYHIKSNTLPTAAGDAGMAALLGFALVTVTLVRPGARALSVVQPAAVAAAGAVAGADQRAGSRGQLHLKQGWLAAVLKPAWCRRAQRHRPSIRAAAVI